MATANLIQQPPGIGQHRMLTAGEKDHLITVLRAVERLPLISEPSARVRALLDGGDGGIEDFIQAGLRQLAIVHINHIEIAALIRAVLIDA